MIVAQEHFSGHVLDECCLCGAQATAIHSGGNGYIAVCGQCAVESLPSLIADAMPVSPTDPQASAKRQWFKVTAHFWRAVAARFSRALEARKI